MRIVRGSQTARWKTSPPAHVLPQGDCPFSAYQDIKREGRRGVSAPERGGRVGPPTFNKSSSTKRRKEFLRPWKKVQNRAFWTLVLKNRPKTGSTFPPPAQAAEKKFPSRVPEHPHLKRGGGWSGPSTPPPSQGNPPPPPLPRRARHRPRHRRAPHRGRRGGQLPASPREQRRQPAGEGRVGPEALRGEVEPCDGLQVRATRSPFGKGDTHPTAR